MSRQDAPSTFSMVFLGPKPRISPTAIKADLKATWPDIGWMGRAEKSERHVLSFEIKDRADVFMTLIGSPIPWSELEGPCATSVLWRNASKVLNRHRAHLLVSIAPVCDMSPLDKAKLLTQVTASVLHTCQAAIGVYWCNATLVIPPGLFREYAVKILPDGPPIDIWVDFRIGLNDRGRMSAFTIGLEALGHMEIETENAPESAAELRLRLEGLVAYLLRNGPVIRDGDTIGEDANERIKVVYRPSLFGHAQAVMRLDYETSEPSKRKGWFAKS